MNRHAPWLINPEKSQTYHFWLALITVALQFELFCIPLVMIWPEKREQYENMFWFCDGIWTLNIPAGFLTIRYTIVSRDGFDIALDYLQTEFLFDFISTFPSMVSNHSQKLMFLRLFHIFSLKKA